MYRIELTEEFKGILGKFNSSMRQRILKKINQLKEKPELGKPLSGNLSGLWTLRIDKYRVLYRILQDKLIIIVLTIGHRKRVY